MFSSAGVAPLPPCFHKLLSETVTTFAVFSSWMYLLDGDDSCMLSVPFSTSDSYCWQSGANCHAMAAGAFHDAQLRTVAFSQRRMISFLSCPAVLPTCYLLHDSRLFGLTLRPSAPVCCCHRVSWARGRLAFAQEAVHCPHSFSSIGSACDGTCLVVSGSL